MTFTRWLPTFLGFGLGGLLAFETVGSLHDPLSAAAGGLLAGAVIGAGQWLALRSRGIGRRWIGYTSAAMAAGTALGALLTGAGTEVADVTLLGLVAGTAVGAAQSSLLPRGRAAWTVVTGATWALAWPISSTIIDLDRGWHVFGSSGALVVTVLTGLTLRHVLGAPGAARPAAAHAA
jgi:hypothetical protein